MAPGKESFRLFGVFGAKYGKYRIVSNNSGKKDKSYEKRDKNLRKRGQKPAKKWGISGKAKSRKAGTQK
jgi:hypothetical protein